MLWGSSSRRAGEGVVFVPETGYWPGRDDLDEVLDLLFTADSGEDRARLGSDVRNRIVRQHGRSSNVVREEDEATLLGEPFPPIRDGASKNNGGKATHN
jgi:hypothetical protein